MKRKSSASLHVLNRKVLRYSVVFQRVCVLEYDMFDMACACGSLVLLLHAAGSFPSELNPLAFV